MNRNFLLVSGFVVLLLVVFFASFFKILYLPKVNLVKKPTRQPIITPPVSTFISTIPTATPLLGPGPYACDPNGVCNSYQDAKGMGCPKTYADPYCLGECADKANRCPK